MNKRKKIEEFLNYGGNELFSTLMGNAETRSGGIDRLVQLLQEYSDHCRRIKGRSEAYRFMLKKAVRYGWLGNNSADLKSHRLTRADRDYIIKHLDDYISSGGRNIKFINNTITVSTIVLTIVLLILILINYMYSEEYQQRLSEYFVNTEIIKISVMKSV